MASQDEVRKLHQAHPQWSDDHIAHALGCELAYVRATAKRINLRLPHGAGIVGVGRRAIELGLTVDDLEALARMLRR